mmetsp:Transcript_64992/g.136163  ORF Transcript_64992/g.136163 Transcript_64992/m.136163 type:complete len:261 (+) Transcript_64992:1494-2276(+)
MRKHLCPFHSSLAFLFVSDLRLSPLWALSKSLPLLVSLLPWQAVGPSWRRQICRHRRPSQRRCLTFRCHRTSHPRHRNPCPSAHSHDWELSWLSMAGQPSTRLCHQAHRSPTQTCCISPRHRQIRFWPLPRRRRRSVRPRCVQPNSKMRRKCFFSWQSPSHSSAELQWLLLLLVLPQSLAPQSLHSWKRSCPLWQHFSFSLPPFPSPSSSPPLQPPPGCSPERGSGSPFPMVPRELARGKPIGNVRLGLQPLATVPRHWT